MNNRIQEIANQVERIRDLYNIGPVHRDAVEQFAELIVKECANHCDLLLDHKISSEWSRGTHDCSRAIKKHFGVE